MKVAIVDNSINPDVYTPVDHWLMHLDVNWEPFRAKKGDLPDLDNFSHLILSGSEASILEGEDWVEREIDLIQEAIRKGMPILGSCYGHQLLALALVGPDYVRNCPEPEVGWITVQVSSSASSSVLCRAERTRFLPAYQALDSLFSLDKWLHLYLI